MITCKLCVEFKPPKSNTHYLTDFIIKTALNEDGVSLRNRGLFFEMDSKLPTVGFYYQQVSTENIEKVLGREATDEENDAAKNTFHFAVNDCFCKDCEDKFGKIETEFSNKLLDKFRSSNLTGVNNIQLTGDEAKLFRIFFLMQFWRVSVCSGEFKLHPATSEFIRDKIYNLNYEGLDIVPLSVTYMETLPEVNEVGNKYKTNNMVNAIEGYNPCVIFMNDFVLQMFDALPILFDDMFGLNDLMNYKDYLNQNKTDFNVKVISNKERLVFLERFWAAFAKKFMNNVKLNFYLRFIKEFSRIPPMKEVYIYATRLVNSNIKYVTIGEKSKAFEDNYFKELAKIYK